jgi:hypothetical protein
VNRNFTILREVRQKRSLRRGSVTIESILVIAAICLPILVFSVKIGWPRIRNSFLDQERKLEQQVGDTTSGVTKW